MKTLLLVICASASFHLPIPGQVRSTINRTSLYSDSVLKQLVWASQLAANRQQLILSRSALRENETSGGRRQSTLTARDLVQLERLSSFSGDRLRVIEELSEHKKDQVSRMQADYMSGVSGRASSPNRVAEIAESNSEYPRPQIQQVLRASEAHEWVRQVKRRAVATRSFAEHLRQRSLSSDSHKRTIDRLSLDQ